VQQVATIAREIQLMLRPQHTFFFSPLFQQGCFGYRTRAGIAALCFVDVFLFYFFHCLKGVFLEFKEQKLCAFIAQRATCANVLHM